MVFDSLLFDLQPPRRIGAVLLALVMGLGACETKSTGSEEGGSPAEPTAEKPTGIDGPRMVILGFDGVDPRRVDALIGQGELPNIDALGKKGYRGPLATTNPPQSPVAWSAFATGLPAAEHGIFDFIGRDLKTHFPKVATTKITQAEVSGGKVKPASAQNLRLGPSFWDVIARAGVPAQALHVPYAYPPAPDGARALGGLGTPDVRGTNSTFTLLTTDGARVKGQPPAGGQVALLTRVKDGQWQAAVAGPRVTVEGQRSKTVTTVVVRADPSGKLSIEAAGEKHLVGVGETSPYFPMKWQPAPGLNIEAVTRATVRAAGDAPEVFLEPLSLVPTAPYLPVASPEAFGAELWKAHGPFKTVGWIHDTSALGAGVIDESQFVTEAMATMKRRAKMTLDALAARQDRVFISVFTAPDRIGHTFFRYLDPDHPAPKDGDAAAHARALDESYREMDRIIGEVVEALGPDDILLIMSDHGFGSFRRGFHINRWLLNQGYLALKAGVKEPRDFFMDVDWTKTKAYAMGTGSIFINVQGRDGHGIVPPGQAPGLAKKIAKQIMNVKDGGRPVVVGAYVGDEIYAGKNRRTAPDVRVALADGYRASWATTLGGIPKGLFEDNVKKWSGDHASADPKDVPGILVSNVAISGEPRIEDLSATAYAFTKVPAPEGVVGRSLLKTP